MPIISLISDMGLNDYYVAAVKARIWSLAPDVKFVDISHTIPHFDKMASAFNLENAIAHFPPGSIHILGVLTMEDQNTHHVVVECENQFFIGADNGIFALALGNKQMRVFKLENYITSSHSFPEVDVFAQAAAKLANGADISELGTQLQGLDRLLNRIPSHNENQISGLVSYIDSYGNLITNITRELFSTYEPGKRFLVDFPGSKKLIQVISERYIDVDEGRPLVLFNSRNYLEIAVNQGNASKLFALKVGQTIRIEFHAQENRMHALPGRFAG